MPIIPKPPYDTNVLNFPGGRAGSKPYNQIRRIVQLRSGAAYFVAINEEWVLKSLDVALATSVTAGARSFYFEVADSGLVPYASYANGVPYAKVSWFYEDLLGDGLSFHTSDITANHSFTTQSLVQNQRLALGDYVLFTMNAQAGDTYAAFLVYENYYQNL